MIFQEEINTSEYNSVLNINPEFPNNPKSEKLPEDRDELYDYKQSRIKLSKNIDIRMEYIIKFLPEYNKYNTNKKYNEFINNIKTSN
jgi:hypothetical protein